MYARQLNAELEKLREEVSETQDVETVICDAQQIAAQIHASYLFENEGKPQLQKLCLLLSATASGKSYGDWQKFAAHLGLLNEQIKCIDYDFKGLQDPTYYVLLAFSQSDEATMDKIFITLRKIQRLDIINQVAESFDSFFQEITKKSSDLKNGIYMPNILPRAPLVLNPILEKSYKTDQNFTEAPVSFNKHNIVSKNVNKKYGSIAMLTFAKDGYKTAEVIAKACRSANPKIGVVILQEQEKHVYSKAEEFIEDCFKQVNYIVPILTEGYLEKINNYVCNDNENNTLDSKYIRYIFALLRYEYVKQDCLNNRVRCIIPDSQVKRVLSFDLHPILQAWFRESDVHLFIEKILLQKF